MEESTKECKIHGLTRFLAYDDKGKKRYRCAQCQVISACKRRKKVKEKAVECLGGKCVKCGYDKCIEALEFHHPDVTIKDFAISNKNVIGWNKIKDELDKCVLLCANCHREEHVIWRM